MSNYGELESLGLLLKFKICLYGNKYGKQIKQKHRD